MNITNNGTIPSFAECFAMTNLVDKGSVIGKVAYMGFLWSGRWQENTSLMIISIITSIIIGLIFLVDLFMFYLIRYYNDRKSITDKVLLGFNFSNVLIYIVITQIGWTINCFFIAACHNSIELVIIILLLRKYFPILFPFEWYYNCCLDLVILIGICFTLPHLILQDFTVNYYLKSVGAITDIILWLFCLSASIKYFIDFFRIKIFKHDIKLAPHRHLLFLLNVLSHTTTVVLTFFSCPNWITQIFFMMVGTYLMNIFGGLYFLVCFLEKYKGKTLNDTSDNSSNLIKSNMKSLVVSKNKV